MAAVGVLLAVAVLVLAWGGFEWVRAGRMKRRMAAGHDVANPDPGAAVRGLQSDPEVNRNVVRPPTNWPGGNP